MADPAGLTKASFGHDFTWGVAHASHQVEGAWQADGKGESIWDRFAHEPRHIRDGSNADVACDYYNRFADDTALAASLGFGAQRFSVSWPRVLPDGTGTVNQKGLDFYKRVVDANLDAGLEPWVTLYHWDLPQALQDRGGWTNRDVVGWFEDYVAVVADALGDRVRNWMIFNEPHSFVFGGMLAGIHAPGQRGLLKTLAGAHHVNLSQAAGARAVRANARDPQVGTTHIIVPTRVARETPWRRKAATAIDAWANRLFLEPNFGLGYPVEASAWMKPVERYVKGDDDRDVVVDWDFVGVQYYTRILVKPAPIPGLWGYPWVSKDHRRYEISVMGQEIQPDGLYESLAIVDAYKKVPRLVVTENGVCVPDHLSGDRVHDSRRVNFFQTHLAEVERARNDDIPVDGYFVWSLMDNFEWAEGYTARFGLVWVDFDTQERVVKDSGLWFREFLAD